MGTRILVVDDSMMVRQQVGRALAQAGFEVLEAKDGVDAVEKLGTAKDVALVVCDVNMPRMDGLEFLAVAAADPTLARIPVVMLTTEGQADRIQRAKALGAKAWLLKPFKAELMVAAVKKITAAAA
jgi:two-component system, chemotaxis family, chemotaxis protein CheY